MRVQWKPEMQYYTAAKEKCKRSKECVRIRVGCAVYEKLHSEIINPESINIDDIPRRLYESNASVDSETFSGPHSEIKVLKTGTVRG